jgi:hypothetical protein
MTFRQLKCLLLANGNADKIGMYQAYLRYSGIKFDISGLPIVDDR